LIGLTALAAGGSLGCQYGAATEACYALGDGIGDRLYTCGYVATPEAGVRAVHDGWAAQGLDCDTSPTGINDERLFYDECFPALEVYDCDRLVGGDLPEACLQIVYRSR
jgi:hypothetical protein